MRGSNVELAEVARASKRWRIKTRSLLWRHRRQWLVTFCVKSGVAWRLPPPVRASPVICQRNWVNLMLAVFASYRLPWCINPPNHSLWWRICRGKLPRDRLTQFLLTLKKLRLISFDSLILSQLGASLIHLTVFLTKWPTLFTPGLVIMINTLFWLFLIITLYM